MRRVLIAVTNDLTYDQRMHRICKALEHGGYQVTLVGRVLKDSIALPRWRFQAVRLRCWFTRGALFYAEYNLRLLFLYLRSGYDIGVACDLDTAMAVQTACRIRKKTSVFDAHELFTGVPELAGRKVVTWIWRQIGRFTIPGFALRYTVGPRLAELLGSRYGCHFAVVRNVPEAALHDILPLIDRKPVILYQGALNTGRGMACAIDAMKYLDGYALQIAGEGDLSDQLRKRVHTSGLSERVVFFGRLEPDQLRTLTRQAMIGLNLLDGSSESYRYSLANKFFDYLHAGVPSVNMDFPEYREIIDKHHVGWCIDTLDPALLASEIRSKLQDKSQLQEMIQACSIARSQFTWEDESIHLLRLYDSIR